VRSTEHGTHLDDEACAAMRELEAILVPTRYIVVRLLEAGTASGMSAENYRKLAAIADTHADGNDDMIDVLGPHRLNAEHGLLVGIDDAMAVSAGSTAPRKTSPTSAPRAQARTHA